MSEKAPVPEKAPKPQDHKPKSPPARKDGPTTVEVLGVSFELDINNADDYEVLEWMADAQQGDPTAMALILRRLVGTDVHRKLKDAARDPETGRVSVEKMGDVLEAIFSELGN